jgi:hypothetical protein
MWNVTLFNIALYFKRALPSGWERAVEQVNAGIQSPLPWAEVAAIIKSVASKEFNYQCNNQPLAQYCNATKCRMRKFGVGGGANSFPILGELRKLDIDPPVYFWDMTIAGKSMTLELSDEQVQNPREFKKRVWQKSGLAIPVMKQTTWDSTLNGLRESDTFQVIAVPKDASTEGLAWELIEQFCTRNDGDSQGDILMGRPWTDAGRTYFRLSDLRRFLLSQQFKDFQNVQQLAKVLKGHKGCDYHENRKIKGKVVNLWSLPEFARQTSGFDLPDSIKNLEHPF